MARTLLLSFQDEQTREYFVKFMQEQSKKGSVFGNICTNILPTISLDPQVRDSKDKHVALFISGKKMSEGPLSTISQQFNAEAHAHSANIQIKELIDGKWRTIRQRLSN